MKKKNQHCISRNLASPLLAISIACFPFGGSLVAQEVLFQDKFENHDLETVPKEIADGGIWAIAREGSNPGAVQVLEDTEDIFGYGTANRYLHIKNGVGF